MDYNEIEEKKQQLTHKTFLMMFHILWVVGIPAFGAYFFGSWLDMTFAMRPYGNVITSIVATVISWTILIRMYKQMVAEYRGLREEEQKLEKAPSIPPAE